MAKLNQAKFGKKKVNVTTGQETLQQLQIIMNDPVLWAKAFVVAMNPETKKFGPWIARDYQAEILRNRDVRKVYRMGRRLGKCLTDSTRILDPTTGEYRTIRELIRDKDVRIAGGVTVASRDSNGSLVVKKQCPIIGNGIKKVYKVVLDNGLYIEATGNHPLLGENGWTEVSNFIPGDFIGIPAALPFFGIDVVNAEEINYRVKTDLNNGKVSEAVFRYRKNCLQRYLYKILANSAIFLDNPKIIYRNTEPLIRDLAHLLRRFGIKTKIISTVSNYQLVIDESEPLSIFIREIGVSGQDSLIKDLIQRLPREPIINSIDWRTIAKIEYVGQKQTYDLTVHDTHNFVANDFLVHNSECMVIDALWQCFTHKNHRVLFITPYENQVELLFRRLKEIISESPLIKREIRRIKGSPYTVELSNGSVILGFTTGASSGGEAASTRGQRADWLFLDELDKTVNY